MRNAVSSVHRTTLAAWLIGFATAAAAVGGEPGDWRRAAVWDDGNAEFCAYDVVWPRYGEVHRGSARIIVVKEPWAPELDVKADTERSDGFEVLKLNHLRDVPTGIYTYHQMASVFVRRDDGALRKMAVTSSEGCGISTALLRRGELSTHSYFDGQGDRRTEWPAGSVPEDGLPLLLRDFVAGDPPATVSVFPSLMAGRFPDLAPSTYTVERRASASAGGSPVVIELARGDDRLRYAFEKEPPHVLVEFERSDGTRYARTKCERIPYWTMNRSGGEAWYD